MTAIPQPKIAFFCMEYGLSEEFPIYTGGLGVLAGDILKAAHQTSFRRNRHIVA